VTILLIDEADALAQSREMAQMHHEDRAGVNAIIRGVDDLAAKQLPVLVIMCTNRLSAIDPAVRRRAAVTVEFQRPNDVQRRFVLERVFGEAGFSSTEIDVLVDGTGPTGGRSYGVTFSDLVQRFIPAVVLECFPDNAVTFSTALSIAKEFVPTPPFREE
jgi:AAA+ superfamily predicted ATPase